MVALALGIALVLVGIATAAWLPERLVVNLVCSADSQANVTCVNTPPGGIEGLLAHHPELWAVMLGLLLITVGGAALVMRWRRGAST